MKRVLIVLSLLVIPSLVLAENKIKMVTYFPVPYVAYSKINAQKQLDVGLTSACEMNLGCAESGALGTKPLQATTVNLNKGRLDLNNASAVKSTNVTLGSGSGEANIDFNKNLRIGTLSNGYSLEANDMTVDELKLFASHMRAGGEKFPSCEATGASGAPQISWQKLKLKSAEEVYLMCGTPAQAAGCDPSSKPATPSPRTCNTCGTQSATVSCNLSTGNWITTWGTCSKTPAQCTPVCTYVKRSYEHTHRTSSGYYSGCSGDGSPSWGPKIWNSMNMEQQQGVSSYLSQLGYTLVYSDIGGQTCEPSKVLYNAQASGVSASCSIDRYLFELSVSVPVWDCVCLYP